MDRELYCIGTVPTKVILLKLNPFLAFQPLKATLASLSLILVQGLLII